MKEQDNFMNKLAEELFVDIEKVVKTYENYLIVKHNGHVHNFKQRVSSDKEAAQIEAITFMLFREYFGFDVKIGENDKMGGVDFICSKDGVDKFLIEVTHIDQNAMSNSSGLSKDHLHSGSFSLITRNLMYKVRNKSNQLSGYSMPRILLIGSLHLHASLLFDTIAAEKLLTGDTKIVFPVNTNEVQAYEQTDLTNSVFFRSGGNGIEPCSKSISSIILANISSNSISVLGLLHPEPAIFLDSNMFPKIPFCRVSNWPCADRKIKTEWIISAPSSFETRFLPIKLRDNELREESK
jgi:hypothetical protein